MKIAFIGAHGTGKTLLAEHLYNLLEKHHQYTYFIPNIAGMVEKDLKVKLTECLDIKVQKEILERQLNEEIKVALMLDYWHIISDGAVLSHYAYFRRLIRKDYTEEDIEKTNVSWNNLDSIVSTWMLGYGKIFKLDIRANADNLVLQIDREINDLLKRFDLKHTRLYDKDRKNWNEIVEKDLGL